LCLEPYGYVYRRGHRKVDMGGEEKTTVVQLKLKEYRDRNLKDKLWQEICESVIKKWSELLTEQKSEKVMLIFLFVVLEIMLMMFIYWAEVYIL
jgi:hypothetical protein